MELPYLKAPLSQTTFTLPRDIALQSHIATDSASVQFYGQRTQ